MLSRRHLRIKILQGLYAFLQSNSGNLNSSEKELLKSINKINELFIYFISILPEIKVYAENKIEEHKNKRLPSEEDLNPNLKFINNRVLNGLLQSDALIKALDTYKISWGGDQQELIKKLYNNVIQSQSYTDYMSSGIDSFEEDLEFVTRIYKNQIADFDLLLHFLEEKNMHWADDWYFVNSYVVKYLKSLGSENFYLKDLPSLYRDQEDDLDFVKTLFRKTIMREDEYQELIVKQAKNWEEDRIAIMDLILMKMAICELTEIKSVPVKVTLNEYIELSKSYSTPKSKLFINGILDKLVPLLKSEGKIKKSGRGLME